MTPLAAVIGIVGIFLALMWLIARTDGLTFMGPGTTHGIRASASDFCVDECRVDGRCPITGRKERDENCPLWKYVDADLPTEPHGSPFEPLYG